MTGELVGIGVGPGDPELLTLKALRLLREMEVIVTIASDAGEPVAERIIAPHLPASRRRLTFRAPMHGDASTRARFYDEAAETIAGELGRERRVGVPCLGDPLFYGSFARLMERLAPRFPCSVVPGVTAVQAASAALRLPLAAGRDSVIVLPAMLPEALLAERLAHAETAVILKLGRHLPRLRRLLAGFGRDFEGWIASALGTAEERLAPLQGWEDREAPYMSLLILRRRSTTAP